MADTTAQDSFRRAQALKSQFAGRLNYGYSHGYGEKIPKTNVSTNEFLQSYRQKGAIEWTPTYQCDHPRPIEITCYAIHHFHIGQIPNYAGHIPGAIFRYGRTFGQDTLDAKRWLRGDHRPN